VPDISIIICTYNGESRLPALLSCLNAQQSNCQWEVVVIDNNSSDRTADIIHQFPFRLDVPLRYVFEPCQGMAFARRCAIKNTTSPLIGFIDDDTLPDIHWVSAAVQFAQSHPQAGAYGSSIRGQYEITPPVGFARIACCLAIIERGKQPFAYNATRGVLPAGAGMVIRRQAWIEQVPDVAQLTGVAADSIKAKGEDVETLSYIRSAWAIWHNPAMKLTHTIPKERLAPQYLQTLLWQVGLNRYLIRRVGYSIWQWPLMIPAYFLSDLKKLIVQLLRLRQIGTVERCEVALLAGALVSPIVCTTHFLKTKLKVKLSFNNRPHQQLKANMSPEGGKLR